MHEGCQALTKVGLLQVSFCALLLGVLAWHSVSWVSWQRVDEDKGVFRQARLHASMRPTPEWFETVNVISSSLQLDQVQATVRMTTWVEMSRRRGC